ncbi:MAG: methylated-DNA--[protein]-cysteine S-methyltransferase [Microthrixaceae bacterium]
MSSDTLSQTSTETTTRAATQTVTSHTLIDSPVGALWATSRGGMITGLRFTATERVEPEADWVSDAGPFEELRRQLEEYFAGDRRSFDIDIEPTGTEFQMQVWSALCDIPYGQTATYGEIAATIGRPTAVRAVGGANNANSIPIVIPCHRVIGADGTLTGFGGGIDAKSKLLDLEARATAG